MQITAAWHAEWECAGGPSKLIMRAPVPSSTMTAFLAALASAIAVFAGSIASAQAPAQRPQSPPPGPVVLVDSTGRIAARPLDDSLMLVAAGDISAPAAIRPVYGADGRAASGKATWQSGGSVLFTSSDCTAGAHVFTSGHAGLRATSQVQTPDGIVLFVGAAGATTTAVIRSILYASGCSPVTVEQNGLVPVEATVNLTVAYPPPLSLQ
jgi:hypothetical protein